MDAKNKKHSIISFTISISVLIMLILMLTYAAIRPQFSYEDKHTQYALVFPLGSTPFEIYTHVVNAGGTPIRSGTFDFIMIVATDQPNFAHDIKNLGAIFVFSPIIKGGCLIENQARFRKK